MSHSAPQTVYNQRIADLAAGRTIMKNKQSSIAWARFACILVMVVSIYYVWPYGLAYTSIVATGLLAAFIRLVILSVKNNERISNLDRLLQVNQQEIDIAAGRYMDLPDGNALLPNNHEYAQDLDIFGRASLYQYINRTVSEQGRQTISAWLLHPADPSTVLQRQEAARELSGQTVWRQQLQAFGMNNQITLLTREKLGRWLEEPNLFAAAYWKWMRVLLPAVIITALLLHLAGSLSSERFYGIVLLFVLISWFISRKVQPAYQQLNQVVPEAATLSHTIDWIEQNAFQSPLLKRLQQCYVYASSTASLQVKSLKAILDRLDYRLNPLVFIPLNTFLLWDLQQVLSLEKWKSENKTKVLQWFDALGEIEALSTLATMAFNHPDWGFPVLDERQGTMIATALGHPLIPDGKRVCNSFSTTGIARIALITGSNMAGKSTFLRSVGINMVLAMMGAPVCATSFTMSPMRVISSMRISDNLEESTSTFYAELKKLKHIIESVNRGERVYLLLDEILRGTNSLDRHTGSGTLIRQLIKHGAVGMLATHDLELAALADELPSHIHNYHFDVQVADEELFFDYKLKEGVCQSMNASILMKKIGIEL